MQPENVAGNHYDKYNTRNPVARFLMGRFLEVVRGFYAPLRPTSVLEVGCGEGHLLKHLTDAWMPREVLGTDLSPEVIAQAQASYGPALTFEAASVYQLPMEDDSFEMVLACEVLEHLEDPRRALEELARVTRRYAIITVPREPLWRGLNMARGAYLGDLGNTPGHIQHFGRRDILKLVRERFEVIQVSSPLPWTAIQARVR
jgi:2-polyprenyl-3-methyl-5-hydroxy-6-metoxy-1,4-benzoquinol methylase